MPFTPLHLGPGLLLKAAFGNRLSLRTFALVQVVIDVESLFNIARHHSPVHGPLHSFVGTFAVGVVTAAMVHLALRRRGWQSPWHPTTAQAAAAGALSGGATHTLIDGLMHSDLAPLWPWSAENPWLMADGSLLATVGCAVALPLGVWLLTEQEDASDPAPHRPE